MGGEEKPGSTFHGEQSIKLLRGFLLPCPAAHIYLDNPGQRFPGALCNPGWARNCERVFVFLQEKGSLAFQPHRPTGRLPSPLESSTICPMPVQAQTRLWSPCLTGKDAQGATLRGKFGQILCKEMRTGGCHFLQAHWQALGTTGLSQDSSRKKPLMAKFIPLAQEYLACWATPYASMG